MEKIFTYPCSADLVDSRLDPEDIHSEEDNQIQEVVVDEEYRRHDSQEDNHLELVDIHRNLVDIRHVEVDRIDIHDLEDDRHIVVQI